MLTIVTILLILRAKFLNIEGYDFYLFFIIGASVLKGILSPKVKEVFNLQKTQKIYQKVGLYYSLDMAFSLLFAILYYTYSWKTFEIQSIIS